MSKNLTIDEGGESRHFDGVKRLKTKLMGEDAGTCYWVPDDETQAWPTFIMNNGLHTAEEEGVYGFTEAMVNVYIPTPFPDWDIWIDDDDIPHIHIDDIDIDIDDIDIHIDDIDISIDDIDGTPVVDIEGIDLDGIEIPNIDIHMDDDGLPTSDIDFKTDIHVWTDEDDPTKIHIKEEPNGEEIVLDYDDIDGTVTFKDLLDIRYDDTVIGEEKWVIEAHTKIKVDDVDYEAGDEIKSWDKDEIVDFTMKVEQVISVDFPDIDPDFGEDFDIELDLDNMELDMDGLDMDIDLPLLKMPDLDDELPDEIRIMHVPDKTSYQDGEAIDLDGIVVQAYKNGSVWQNKKYIDGYVPAHELSIEPYFADGSKAKGYAHLSKEYILADNHGVLSGEVPTSDTFKTKSIGQEYDYRIDRPTFYEYDIYNGTGLWFYYYVEHDYAFLARVLVGNQETIGEYTYTHGDYKKEEDIPGVEYTKDGKTVYYTSGWTIYNIDYELGYVEVEGEYVERPVSGSILEDKKELKDLAWDILYGRINKIDVTVSWPRPVDSLALTASFQISVDPAEDTTSTGS